jgi:hypothetical protein
MKSHDFFLVRHDRTNIKAIANASFAMTSLLMFPSWFRSQVGSRVPAV